MKKLLLSLWVCLLFPIQALSADATIDMLNSSGKHFLKNLEFYCDGENHGSYVVILQDGAQVEMPFKAIQLMRSLQTANGFYIKTVSGKELTNCKMACQNYSWTGLNEYGGKTSISGNMWHEIRFEEY